MRWLAIGQRNEFVAIVGRQVELPASPVALAPFLLDASSQQKIEALTRLRLRGPKGANDEFLLAATAQNLRRLARLRPMNVLPEKLAA